MRHGVNMQRNKFVECSEPDVVRRVCAADDHGAKGAEI